MKLKTIFGSLFLLLSFQFFGQTPCLPNGITLSNQDVATNFAANYPGCTVIQGDVLLGGALNFIGMEQLIEIQGNIRCGGDGECSGSNGQAHEDFQGLENVISIGGIILEEHAFSFAGLESLEIITGDLRLEECNFENFEPLYGLVEIGGSLLSSESNFESFKGLDNLNTIQGSLRIEENEILGNSEFITALNEIGGSFYLGDCEILEDVNGFSGLTLIGSNLTVDDCPLLPSLDGLDNISEINGELILTSNNILFDISGIANLAPQGISFLKLQNNPLLSYCAVASVCSHLLEFGMHEIGLNSSGCLDANGISNECLSANILNLAQENFKLINTSAESYLYLSNPGALEFIIRDGLGKAQQKSCETNKVSIENLSSGIYFLNVTSSAIKYKFYKH